MARKKTQAYTEEFRREAVKRADKEGNTAASVARELGIHPGQIYNWRRQFKRLSDKQFNTMDGVDYSKKESEEIRKLKREKAALEKELEFVKRQLRTSRTTKSEVRINTRTQGSVFNHYDVSSFKGISVWLLSLAKSPQECAIPAA